MVVIALQLRGGLRGLGNLAKLDRKTDKIGSFDVRFRVRGAIFRGREFMTTELFPAYAGVLPSLLSFGRGLSPEAALGCSGKGPVGHMNP